MEMHFTAPELTALSKAIERDLKDVKTTEGNALEIEILRGLKIRFDRKLEEYQQKQKNL